MDRFWLLTSTTYGTWLPGDRRGFVSPVQVPLVGQEIHNIPGTPYDSEMVELRSYSGDQLNGPSISLTQAQADVLHLQFHETARYRNWELQAVGIMATHVHIVIGVIGDPEPEDLLRDFKAYGSRALNKQWDKPKSDTWWTESGSKRILRDEAALRAAIEYVRNQERPLVIWIAGENPVPIAPASGGRKPPGSTKRR